MWYCVYPDIHAVFFETGIIWRPFYFKSFQNAKFAATHREMTTKTKYQLISKTFVKNIMRVRIWGNPRRTSNLNCLFWMHNWKWMDLSKWPVWIQIEYKVALIKKHNLSLRHVVFFPFRCCFADSLRFSSSTAKQTKVFHSTFWDVFFFLREKLFPLNVC